jgi:hypothetical protein
MGTLGDISNLILQAYRLWQERHAGFTVTPQEMFDKYVGPSYQLLKQIHGDYMDLYLELLERIALDDPLSNHTVQWFEKARARHRAERSELRLMQIPRQTSRTQRSMDINTAGTEYLSTVSDYFIPAEIAKSASRARIKRKTPSASSFTAARLHVLHYWSRLSPASQRAFAVEELLEMETQRLREELIENLLEAVAGILTPESANYVESVALEAEAEFQGVSLSMRDAIAEGRFPWVIEGFDWRDILNEHIRVQCSAFETSLQQVQRAYFHFRILADRQ